jgi:two-component system phosphate regulon sensor histidine kinase PhoR
MTKGNAISLRKLWRPAAAFAAPSAAVFILLWAIGVLEVGAAVAALVVAVVGTGFVVRLLLTDLLAIGDYAESVGQNFETRRPRLTFTDTLIQLLVGIRRLARAGERVKKAQESYASTSGLDHLPDPVLMLDTNRGVIKDNAAARQLLGPGLVGRDLAAVIRNPAIFPGCAVRDLSGVWGRSAMGCVPFWAMYPNPMWKSTSNCSGMASIVVA